MTRPLLGSAFKALGLRKGQVYQKETNPILLLVARIRIAGRATRRSVPVQTWLGGTHWGMVRLVHPRNFTGLQAWKLVKGP